MNFRYGQLFAGGSIGVVFSDQFDKIRKAIANATADELVDPKRIDEWCLMGRVQGLELADKTETIPEEASAGFEVTVTLAFRGSPSLLNVTPTTVTMSMVTAEVADSQIVLRNTFPNPAIETIRRWRDREIQTLRSWIGQVNADVATHNAGVEREIQQIVAARQKQLHDLESLKRALND